MIRRSGISIFFFSLALAGSITASALTASANTTAAVTTPGRSDASASHAVGVGETRYIIEPRPGGFLVRTQTVETTKTANVPHENRTRTLAEYFVPGKTIPVMSIPGAQKIREVRESSWSGNKKVFAEISRINCLVGNR